MSHLGKSGWRSKRAATARIADWPSATPFAYTLRLRSTTGCPPFPVIRLAHSSLVPPSSSCVPFQCRATIPQQRSIGLYLL